MPATPVKIGPFTGGLNTYSDSTAVADAEVVDVLNLDIDLDGSLFSRAPFLTEQYGPDLPGNSEIYLLGWFIWTDGTRYLIMSAGYDPVGGGSYTTHARNETTKVWTTISSDFAASAFVQYANQAWLIAGPTDVHPGGSWDPVAGFVADSDIPKGTTACIYKERLFVAGGITQPNRIYFSDPANFGVFQTSINFFDARSGDGQPVVKLKVFQDTVVIFKTKSTYAFAYDSAPARGAVRVINSDVGATNRYCVVEHDNSLYVLFGDKVYQFVNWTYTQANIKVPFVYSEKWALVTNKANTLSVLTDRLLVHFSDNMYVFNLKNATWTRWDFRSQVYNFNYFIKVPHVEGEDEKYYAGTRINSGGGEPDRRLIGWAPSYGDDAEDMDCYVVTKTYDFNVSHVFKRLFWWGADILSKTDLSYIVHPIAYYVGVTHEQMHAYTHDQLHSGSHLQPLAVSIDVTDSLTIGNVSGNRMFVKLRKSLRFRQIFFTLSGTTNGSLSQAPLRIYSLTAFIDTKQLVTKEIS